MAITKMIMRTDSIFDLGTIPIIMKYELDMEMSEVYFCHLHAG